MKCKRPVKLRVDLKIHGGMERGTETDEGGEVEVSLVSKRRLRLRRGMFLLKGIFGGQNPQRGPIENLNTSACT